MSRRSFGCERNAAARSRFQLEPRGQRLEVGNEDHVLAPVALVNKVAQRLAVLDIRRDITNNRKTMSIVAHLLDESSRDTGAELEEDGAEPRAGIRRSHARDPRTASR